MLSWRGYRCRLSNMPDIYCRYHHLPARRAVLRVNGLAATAACLTLPSPRRDVDRATYAAHAAFSVDGDMVASISSRLLLALFAVPAMVAWRRLSAPLLPRFSSAGLLLRGLPSACAISSSWWRAPCYLYLWFRTRTV